MSTVVKVVVVVITMMIVSTVVQVVVVVVITMMIMIKVFGRKNGCICRQLLLFVCEENVRNGARRAA